MKKNYKLTTPPCGHPSFKKEGNLPTSSFSFSAFLLFSFLLFSFLPSSVYAAGGNITGAGTSNNPFLIEDVLDLERFKQYVEQTGTAPIGGFGYYIGADKYWKLTNNITWGTASSLNLRIGIDDSKIFTGHFDGGGYTINMYGISNSNTDYVAFFSATNNVTIKNLNLTARWIEGRNMCGGLIGKAINNTTLENVHVKITDKENDIYGTDWGGLIGLLQFTTNNRTATINYCSVIANGVRLSGPDASYDYGGLIGDASTTSSGVTGGKVNIYDCLADVRFYKTSLVTIGYVGGIVGYVGYVTLNMYRCFTTADIYEIQTPNYRIGAIVGSVASSATCNGICVHHSGSSIFTVLAGGGIYNDIGTTISSNWLNDNPYALLERKNNNGATIANSTRGNEKWGFDLLGRPKLSKTGYVVCVTRGSGVSISDATYSSGNSFYTNADKKLTVSTTLSPSLTQRVDYTFEPNYTRGSEPTHTHFMSGNNWILTPYASGMVSSKLINIPYPVTATAGFNQWAAEVNIAATYSNPDNLSGKFYIYMNPYSSGNTNSWALIDSTGVVENGNNRSVSKTISDVTFNQNQRYCIAFRETSNPPPAHPNDIGEQFRKTVSVNTAPSLGNWTATATGQTTSIAVTFTADTRLNNSGSTAGYNYSILRSIDGSDYSSWGVDNIPFSGESSYTHNHTGISSSCILNRYKVVINAFGTSYSKETNVARITGTTKFAATADSIKASKGEYANYVRLQWKVNKQTAGDPETFRVFRRVANTNSAFIELETVTSSAATVYWNDNNAMTGVYYEYKVTLYQVCSNLETELESKHNIGFTQAFGTVLGRVTYGTGTAVPDVNVLVRRSELQQGESQYRSLKSTGGGQKFEWQDTDTAFMNQLWRSKQWTYQFWLNPESGIPASPICTLGYMFGSALRLHPVTGGYQLSIGLISGTRTITIPANQYTHVSVQRDGDVVRWYVVNDQNPDNITIHSVQAAYTSLAVQGLAYCKLSLGHDLRGFVDDVRLWNKALNEQEIMNTYSRRLVGNENRLAGYWTFDEGLTGYAFDMSRIGTVYNGRHATTNKLIFDTHVPNEKYQLALKGITDANGNYQIGGIPYSGEGTSYSIVPTLGVHEFNPKEHLRYISPTSMVHNGTDFIDISSFEVSGNVVYEGGNYPVSGCSFEIDGKPLTMPNGDLVKSDYDGFFTISVPIGIHSVRVVKQGHTFANDGYRKNAQGGDFNYNAPVSGVRFYDQTRIKLTGRVTGGLIESEKPLGFGESVNNIGVHTIVLNSERQAYNLTNVPFSETCTHNQGQWKKPGGLSDDQTTVTYNPKNITIKVSPVTGEFVAMIYPERYNFTEIIVPGAGGTQRTVYDDNEGIDFTNAAFPDNSFLKTSVRKWIDSLWVSGKPGILDHWDYFEVSDTVRYNAEWKYTDPAYPTFGVKQIIDKDTVDFFGEEFYVLKEELTGVTDTIALYNRNTGTYLFGKPVFKQGEEYSFFFKAYEEYTNYVSSPPVTQRYPVKTGKVNFYNSLKGTPEPEVIPLDSIAVDSVTNQLIDYRIGEVTWKFTSGAPALSAIGSFFATLSVTGGKAPYYWDMGELPMEVWQLGSKSTGTDFMTHGPDRITTILRDPPGSKSKSFIEEGTTVSTKNSFSGGLGISTETSLTASLGPKIKSFVGLGAGIITDSKVTLDFSGGVKTAVKFSAGLETTETTTFTERFETSDDPLYVGHYGDRFIGNSTNIQYGLTNSIIIAKNYVNDFENKIEGAPKAESGVYSIVPAVSIAYGTVFNTRFAFTQVGLENTTIPQWRNALSILLKPVGTQVNTAFITSPVYVSNLPHSDKNFGKLNTDKIAFPSTYVSGNQFHNGPSYTIYFPDNYDLAQFVLDTVMYYNNQINGWLTVLAQNEKEKVEMQKIGNYSFGGGGMIQYTDSYTSSSVTTLGFNTMLNPTVGLKTGAEVMGIGMELEIKTEYITEFGYNNQDLDQTSITSGFILQEDGFRDQITVDYGLTASGTMAFKTLGGRTSCPYEDLQLTKYYQPGQHILNEATMQVEAPRIRVASAPSVINVPANKEATFLLAFDNESQTKDDLYYLFAVSESTNPYGAEIKIDGLPIGAGRTFLVEYGKTLYKTLTVKKGTVDNYENIELYFCSPCQSDPTDFWPDIIDFAYISAHFIPGCSDVAITQPTNNWILNTENKKGDTLMVTLSHYDINFPNFGYIKLEQRPVSSPTWSTIMTFYPSHLYDKAQGQKENIGDRSVIEYLWSMTGMSDGQYELRATTASVNIAPDSTIIGLPLSTFTTDAVAGYKDVTRPTALGAPSPTNGILGIGDEISITFNEDIQTGRITKNNFTISGIFNEQEIAEPNVGIAFAGGSNSAHTELPIFTGGSFSIETWFMRNPNTEGTLFSFGSNNNNISLGFNTAGYAILKNGNEIYTSVTPIVNDVTWKYVALAYDRTNNTVSVFRFDGTNSAPLFTEISVTTIPETQGKLIVGNNFLTNNGFNGAVSQLHFYGINRYLEDVSADKGKLKSGREHGLIGYWPLDEGEGAIATDKARARHLTLNTNWYIYPSGYAKHTNGNYFTIYTSEYPLNSFSDLTLEFWFRSFGNNQPNQTLFSLDKVYIATDENERLTLYKNDGTVIKLLTTKNLMDAQWHHFALSVKRNGNATVYINGINTATFSETQLGSLSSGYYYFGAKYEAGNYYSQYFAGYFDEIRIWNSVLSRESIMLNKNSKLRGNELGLKAYYPFETYTEDGFGSIYVTPTDENMADTDNFVVEGTATGFSTIAAPIKNVPPVENISLEKFSFVASNNKIVLTLSPDQFARVEGTVLTISVSDIYDMRNNPSNTETWTAFVRRNPLRWDTDPVYIKMQEGETKTFTARIVNVSGNNVSYSIGNLPSWLSVNNATGSLQPLANRELTFTVFQGINIGNYETALGLTSGNGTTEILPVQVKVTGKRPGWTVNPADYESNMNVTGQIAIEGIFQEDPDDLLGAFIGDECVGVVNPLYVSELNAYFTFLTIYGNSVHAGSPIVFKLWDAGTGSIYSVIESTLGGVEQNLVFVANSIKGNVITPVIHNALDYIEQSITLANGWNWISVNVTNSNPSIMQQFKGRIVAGELLKGQTGFIQNLNNFWVGSLTSIDKEKMYILKTGAASIIRFDGKPANPATSPISLFSGWNWLGYIPQFTLPLNEALAGLNAHLGDQIKGHSGYRTYMGAMGWIGSLNYMRAGEGYMYFSGTSATKTFNYPSTASQIYGVMAPSDTIENRWTVDVHKYQNTMTLTSIVLQDDVELQDGLIEIAAFAGNECRGTILMQEVPLDEHPFLGFLLVFGDGNETLTFKLYNHNTGKEYTAQQQVNFLPDAIHGTLYNPFILSYTTSVGIEEINKNNVDIVLYPNPVTDLLHIRYSADKIDLLNITDVVGRTIISEQDFVKNSIDLSAFTQGIYFLKATVNGQTSIHKFIKKSHEYPGY